jgi:hypothetical protein
MPPIPRISRRHAIALAAVALAPLNVARAQAGAVASDEASFDGIAGTRVRFASVAEARQRLSADDAWMRATSAWQRSAVMQRRDAVSWDEFRRWNADAALPWSAEQRARWTRALEALAPVFARLRVPLPGDVWLVSSNGQESADAPYTRGDFVALTTAFPAHPVGDVFLMAHELWHVASRHHPTLATRLYAELGFEPVPTLDFPPAWAARRIANPDAPDNRHAMRITVDGRERLGTPVLVAGRTELQPGETFFSVLEVRLLEVQVTGTTTTAVLRDGEPVWHAVDGAHGFLRRLGGNTAYVMHPEETLAENIALMAIEGRGRPARNPELLARLRAVLQAQPR